MSIKNFEQFINESVEINKERLSNNDVINDTFSKLVNKSRQIIEQNVEKLIAELKLVDRAIEMINERYGEHIIGEPEIRIAESVRDLDYKNNDPNYRDIQGVYEIYLEFNTDMPSIERDNYYNDLKKLKEEIEDVFYYGYVNYDKKKGDDIFGGDLNTIIRLSFSWENINASGTNGKKDVPMKICLSIDGITADELSYVCFLRGGSKLEHILKF